MEFKELIAVAVEVKESYRRANHRNRHQPWGVAEYLQGFMGDIGDLAKLVMAKNNFRHKADIDQKLGHELSDCLWSIIVLADELGMDLEAEFLSTMEELKQRLSNNVSPSD